jgi:hypothetical protein
MADTVATLNSRCWKHNVTARGNGTVSTFDASLQKRKGAVYIYFGNMVYSIILYYLCEKKINNLNSSRKQRTIAFEFEYLGKFEIFDEKTISGKIS